MKYLVWSEEWCSPRVEDSFEEARELAQDEASSGAAVYVVEATHMWCYYVPQPAVKETKEF